MKTLARCSLLAITLFLCAAPAISTEWECGLKIKRNGQVVALPVYLYYKQNLTVPIRTGMSTANQIDVEQNFSFDIDDGPNYTQEPNSPNASWRYIVPGDYTLRVDSYYVYITILPAAGHNRDFTILNESPGDFRGGMTPDRLIIHDDGGIAWQQPTVCNLTLDQKTSDNVTTGNIFHVFTDGGEIWTNATSETIPVTRSATQTLRADRTIYNSALASAEKYNNWNLAGDVSNHKAFDTDAPALSLVSNLKAVDATPVVTTKLLDFPSTTIDSIEFQDPWFVDYADPTYSGLLRNRGTSSTVHFHTRLAPFAPNTTTAYEGNQLYNGVFLNQGSGFVWPFYSVGTKSTVTYGGTAVPFCGWTGTNVIFQNSSALRTGIIFTATNAQAQATYKAHLGSNASTATGYNGQRKVAKGGGYCHMVYESAGAVWYSRSSDNGANWDPEQQVATGTNPSLCADSYDNVYVVFDFFDGSVHYVDGRSKGLTGGWNQLTGVEFNGTTALKPAIYAWAYDGGSSLICTVVVYANGYGGNGSPGLYYIYQNGAVFIVAKVPETSSTCANPSISYANLAYSDGNAIYQKHFTYGTSDLIFETRQMVSSDYVSGRTLLSISNPSIDTRFNTSSYRRTVTAWQATQEAYPNYRPIFIRHPVAGTTENPTFVTTIFDWTTSAKGRTPAVTTCVSASDSNPDVAAVWQHDPSNANGSYPYVVAVNKVNGTFGAQRTLSTNGRYCTSIQGNASQLTGGAMAAWTAPTGPIYAITANQGTNGTLSKGSDVHYARGVDVNLASLGIDGFSGTVSLYAEETDVAKVIPTSRLKSVSRDYLSFAFQSARSTSLDYQLTLFNLKVPSALSTKQGQLPVFSALTATETGATSALATIRVDDLVRLWAAKKAKLSDVNEIAISEGAFNGILPGTLLTVALSTGSLATEDAVRLYEFVLASDSSSLQKEAAQQERVPETYELFNNYPNPFNPSTMIRFALPGDGRVRLVVYDALGREVSKLADGPFAAGYHGCIWSAEAVASGVYLARLQVTDELGNILFAKTSKLLLMK